MLERLKLQDFQSHRKLVLRFDPGVTTIVGSSDVGKSAVVRALAWVVFNKPGGNAFVRFGSGRAVVSLAVDGRRVVRRRGAGAGGENGYALDGREYKSFGTDVPEPVRRVLNLSPANFQFQHDAPFWFSDSSGEVGRGLNQLVNLGAIDAAAAYLGRLGRDAAASVRAAESRAADAGLAWREVSDATEIDTDLRQVEVLFDHVNVTHQNATRLTEALSDVSRCQERVNRASALQPRAGRTLDLGSQWENLERQSSVLRALLDGVGALERAAAYEPPDVTPLEEWAEKKRVADEGRLTLSRLLDRIEDCRASAREASLAAYATDRELETLIGRAGGVCPACGQPWEPGHAEPVAED